MYLIIGASSFIGNKLYNYCKKENIEVLGTYNKNCLNKEYILFDITRNSLFNFCDKEVLKKISAVIICGANTSIDSCKKNNAESYQLNVISTMKILEEINQLGIKCVFLSSEAVFDGTKGMYTEDDIPNPITVYGNQKYEIEQFIQKNMNNYLIFRISRAVDSLFGEKDIFQEFYCKIKVYQDIVCLKNQSFCVTHVEDISRGIVGALKKNLEGIYHLSSSNYISRYQLAKIYADRIFGGYEKIYEKEFEDISFLDNRHIYGGLRGDKLAQILNMKYQNLDEILNRYIETFTR